METAFGKKLSYNNYADIESAISIVKEFDIPACSIIKHANPCGNWIKKHYKKHTNMLYQQIQ